MSAKFSSAGLVEMLIWNSRMADLPRGSNRAQIERLANGNPPYTAKEKEENRIDTNVNFLEMPEILADARRSYYNAFLKPGQFFTITVDAKDPFKGSEWGKILTREINRPLKKSRAYFNFILTQGAMLILHGIGPGVWRDQDHWCPKAVGIEDVLIPSDTDCSLENLPYLAIFRQLTAMELYQATHGEQVDKAWNMPLVEAALKWANSQWWKERSYADLYAPQKLESLYQQDLGYMGTDAVPTIDCWDFYYWDDADKHEGWRRKMVLDTPPAAQVSDRVWKKAPAKPMPSVNVIEQSHGQWLYDAGDRVWADKLDSIIHFQFADCSGIGPSKYHERRGLGMLLYAPAHISNRLRCRFMDAAFENTTQLFRVANLADHERVVKVELQNRGELPEGVNFVKPEERWQVNEELLMEAIKQNEERMQAAAAQYREGRDQEPAKERETATSVMAKVNAANALVGSMLMQAYKCQTFQYEEICRRFTKSNSVDRDVRDARARILKAQVPEEVLNDSSSWNIEPERVLGAGNKVLEVAMADKLMQAIHMYDPESQREILEIYTMANTDNPEMTSRLVGRGKRQISDSVHDAQLMLGSLMQGIALGPVKGQNSVEVAQTLLAGMGNIITRIKMGLTPPTMQDVVGLNTIGSTVQLYMQQIAQDKDLRDILKGIGKVLAGHMKDVQEMTKALNQPPQGEPGGNGQGGVAPEDAVKLRGMDMVNRVKAQNLAQSHAQKTQQREVQFRMKLDQDRQKHAADLQKKAQDARLDAATKDVTTAAEIRRNRLRALEPKQTKEK